MELLISKADFLAYKLVSKGVTDARMDTIIQEAQFVDLRCKMGDELYYKVIGAVSDYSDLINGCTFTAPDGIEKQHQGLKAVLVYLAWGRYAMFGSVQDTAFGSVMKTNEWSQPESQASKRDRRDEAYQVADEHWKLVLQYIEAAGLNGSKKCGEKQSCDKRIRVIR